MIHTCCKIQMHPKLVLAWLFLCCSIWSKAQPTWDTSTQAEFFYTILDEQNEEISFQNNPEYSIVINNKEYVAPNIPKEPLKTKQEIIELFTRTKNFWKHIKINDFQLSISTTFNEQNNKYIDIQIKHNKEVMHINQGWLGRGQYSETLQFMPGFFLLSILVQSNSISHSKDQSKSKV